MRVKVISVPNGPDIQTYIFEGNGGAADYGTENVQSGSIKKALAVTAGVHGCEYVGIQAVLTLIQELKLNEDKISGRVILIPLVNEAGFYDGAKQIVPEDGCNLNRAFPGGEDGTLSARIAAALEQELYPDADFILDLHSGDVNERLTPLVFCPVDGVPEVNRAAKRAAKALSVPYCVASTAKNGLYSWAVQQGIPALLLERGCQGEWNETEVTACVQDVYILMEYLGICREEDGWGKKQKTNESAENRKQLDITRASYIEAPADGFWYPKVAEGQMVKKDDLLGELRTMNGQLVERYTAEFDGVVMYYTISLGIKKEDNLIAIGAVM